MTPDVDQNPWSILRFVLRMAPSSRFLLLVLGAAAVGAITLGMYVGNWLMALVAPVVVLVLAVPAILIGQFSRSAATGWARLPLMCVVWAFVSFAIAIPFFLILYAVWGVPASMGRCFGVSQGPALPENCLPVKWDEATLPHGLTERKYSLLSAVVMIDVEPDVAGTGMDLTERVVYALLPHGDIQPDDKSFTEMFYGLVPDARIAHWYGSDEETLWSPNADKPYDVKITARRYVPRTVVTGARISYTFASEGWKNGRRVPHSDWPPLAANQAVYSYPNLIDADYIHSLTVIIDSRRYRLTKLNASGWRPPNQTLAPLPAVERSSEPGSHGLVSTWTRIIPGDVLNVIYQFDVN